MNLKDLYLYKREQLTQWVNKNPKTFYITVGVLSILVLIAIH